MDSTFSSLISRTLVVNCTNYFLQTVKATLLANWTISVGGPSMGRFRKGRIGKQKKKRLVPVTVHETRMGKEQHTAYVQLLEDVLGTQAGNRQSHSRAPPPRIMSLSSLRHPGRKIAKINKNLTEAFNAANNAVFNFGPWQNLTDLVYLAAPWTSIAFISLKKISPCGVGPKC